MGYSLEGIGMARPSLEHQRISRNIVINYYNQTGFKTYEAFQEGNASFSDPDSLIPDVVFFSVSDSSPVVAIEIETGYNYSRLYARKVVDYFAKYGMKEVFLYDYVTKKWERYSIKANKKSKKTAYSDILQCDISHYTALLSPTDMPGLSGLFT